MSRKIFVCLSLREPSVQRILVRAIHKRMSRHLTLALPCTTIGICWREVLTGLSTTSEHLQAGSIPVSPINDIAAEPVEHIAIILGEPVTVIHVCFFVIGLCLPQLLEIVLAVRELLSALAHLVRRAAVAVRSTNRRSTRLPSKLMTSAASTTLRIELDGITISLEAAGAELSPIELKKKAIEILSRSCAGSPLVATSSLQGAAASATLRPDDVSWTERLEAASRLGEAAACVQLGKAADLVDLATDLRPRLWLVAVTKQGEALSPAARFRSKKEAAELVEEQRGISHPKAVWQSFPSEKEAAAWEQAYRKRLAAR